MKLIQTVASLSFMLVVAGAFGQDTEPTLAQTTEYIRANYPRNIRYSASDETKADGLRSRTTVKGEIRDIKVEFADTRVTFTYHDELHSSLVGSVETRDGDVRLDKEEDIKDIQVVVTFDLKDIESIEGATESHLDMLSYDASRSGNVFPMYLVFNAANGKRVITRTVDGEARYFSDVWIPYGTDAKDDNHKALKDLASTPLYKAFEHLRKLSVQ